jgi:hypothetical protein
MLDYESGLVCPRPEHADVAGGRLLAMDEFEPHPYTFEGAMSGLGRFADGVNRKGQYRRRGSSDSSRLRWSRFRRAIVLLALGLMLGGLISGLVFGLR